MKKILALLLIAVFMLSFTACKRVEGNTSSILSSTESFTEITENNSSTNSEVEEVTSVVETIAPTDETPSETVEKTDNTPSKVESIQKENSTTNEVTSSEDTKPESKVEDVQQIIKATAKDTKEIASLVAEYINAERNKSGQVEAIVLSGLTEYAEYRSRQIVTNFSHDTFDERSAATALEYGRYTDPALFGVDGEPFYSAEASEAILKTDYSGSKEQVAQSIVNLVIGSSSHWSYVGDGENKYIGIGITCENGTWYCDIAVSKQNYEK